MADSYAATRERMAKKRHFHVFLCIILHVCLLICQAVSPLRCLLESNLCLNGHLLYPACPPPSSIHHTTTRTYTLPLRGPLNQALHMPDPHLLSPPLLSTTPFSSPHLLLTLWLLLCCCCCCCCPTLPSATRQQRVKEEGRGKKKSGEKRVKRRHDVRKD